MILQNPQKREMCRNGSEKKILAITRRKLDDVEIRYDTVD